MNTKLGSFNWRIHTDCDIPTRPHPWIFRGFYLVLVVPTIITSYDCYSAYSFGFALSIVLGLLDAPEL